MTGLSLLICLLAAPPPANAATPIIKKAPPQDGVIVAGVIPRAQFTTLMAGGPQRFIAGVRVMPAIQKGKFRGYRLDKILPTSPLAGSENIRVGDVVAQVNGHSLERPEWFMRAWAALKKADRIDVQLLRAGQPMVYRWTVSP